MRVCAHTYIYTYMNSLKLGCFLFPLENILEKINLYHLQIVVNTRPFVFYDYVTSQEDSNISKRKTEQLNVYMRIVNIAEQKNTMSYQQ